MEQVGSWALLWWTAGGLQLDTFQGPNRVQLQQDLRSGELWENVWGLLYGSLTAFPASAKLAMHSWPHRNRMQIRGNLVTIIFLGGRQVVWCCW